MCIHGMVSLKKSELFGLLMAFSAPVIVPLYAIYKIATNLDNLKDIIRRPDFSQVPQEGSKYIDTRISDEML